MTELQVGDRVRVINPSYDNPGWRAARNRGDVNQLPYENLWQAEGVITRVTTIPQPDGGPDRSKQVDQFWVKFDDPSIWPVRPAFGAHELKVV